MSVSGLGSNLLFNASQYYDPAGAEKANLAMQQAVKARAEFGGPHMSLYPDVFGQPQQPYTGPQAAAPSPAGGPRPPMPGQASTPAPTVPLYKAMPGTPAMGAPAAPVSLPPKPTPQPTAGQPTTPQQAAAQPAAHPAAPAWASPNFQPTDVRDAEQRFFANPQLRQQAIARRDYLIAQGIPKATAESWVNEEVGKLWGLQQQVLDHQNDQHIKFMQEQEKLLHEESATYKLEHPGAASQIGKVMEDMRTGRLTASEGRAAIAKLTHVAAPAGHTAIVVGTDNQIYEVNKDTQQVTPLTGPEGLPLHRPLPAAVQQKIAASAQAKEDALKLIDQIAGIVNADPNVVGLKGTASRVIEGVGGAVGIQTGSQAHLYQQKMRELQNLIKKYTPIGPQGRVLKGDLADRDQIVQGLGAFTSAGNAISSLQSLKNYLNGGSTSPEGATPPTTDPLVLDGYRFPTRAALAAYKKAKGIQ